MRTLVALLLLVPAVALLPTASAECTAEDPTHLTFTCVGEHASGSTDPECSAPGSHYGMSGASSYVPGLGGAGAYGESRCANQSWGRHDSQFVIVNAHLLGNSVMVHYSDWETNGQPACRIGANSQNPITGYIDPYVPCPTGTVPRVPFGRLL